MKKFALPIIGVFALLSCLWYVVHYQILLEMYVHTFKVWRSMEALSEKKWLTYVGHLFFSIVFVLIYSKGYEAGKPGLGQGLRFGFLVGLLLSIGPALYAYVAVPVHVPLALSWMASGVLSCTACGALTGILYR